MKLIEEPKILILSKSFSSGDAVTAMNLFSKWNSKNLICASFVINENYKYFNTWYYFGNLEMVPLFPFNLFKKIHASQVIDQHSKNILYNEPVLTNTNYFFYKKFIQPLLEVLGLYESRIRIKLSDQFCTWVKSNNPTYIYTSVGSIMIAKLLLKIKKAFPEIKLIIHGYDDWIYPPYFMLFKKYFINNANYLFECIIRDSSILLSNSELMSLEYQKRYKREFKTFYNPVIINEVTKNKRGKNTIKHILFTGKIDVHNIDAINEMIDAIDLVNNRSAYRVKFDIYSGSQNIGFKKSIKENKNIILHKAVPHDEIPKVLACADLLFLPISISKNVAYYTKYSMSTKIGEYFVSKVPVLYYGPEGIAMTDFVMKHDCAKCVMQKGSYNLFIAILDIFENRAPAEKRTANAYYLVREQFEKSLVSQAFYENIVPSK